MLRNLIDLDLTVRFAGLLQVMEYFTHCEAWYRVSDHVDNIAICTFVKSVLRLYLVKVYVLNQLLLAIKPHNLIVHDAKD